jgi:hypothetical protein
VTLVILSCVPALAVSGYYHAKFMMSAGSGTDEAFQLAVRGGRVAALLYVYQLQPASPSLSPKPFPS